MITLLSPQGQDTPISSVKNLQLLRCNEEEYGRMGWGGSLTEESISESTKILGDGRNSM